MQKPKRMAPDAITPREAPRPAARPMLVELCLGEESEEAEGPRFGLDVGERASVLEVDLGRVELLEPIDEVVAAVASRGMVVSTRMSASSKAEGSAQQLVPFFLC